MVHAFSSTRVESTIALYLLENGQQPNRKPVRMRSGLRPRGSRNETVNSRPMREIADDGNHTAMGSGSLLITVYRKIRIKKISRKISGRHVAGRRTEVVEF